MLSSEALLSAGPFTSVCILCQRLPDCRSVLISERTHHSPSPYFDTTEKKYVHLAGTGNEGEGQRETYISNAANFLREKHRLLNDIRKVVSLYYGMRSS